MKASIIDEITDLYLSSKLFGRVRVLADEDIILGFQTIPGYHDYSPAPSTMISGSPDESGFSTWRPTTSPIDFNLIERFERFLNCRIPKLLRDYLMHKCLLEMNFGEAVLPEISPEAPLAWLQWVFQQQKTMSGLIVESIVPFTYGPYHVNFLCFDTISSKATDDSSILLVSPRSGSSEKVFENFYEFFLFVRNLIEYKSKLRDQTLCDWLLSNSMPVPANAYFEDL